MPTREELKQLQALPLEVKIRKTQQRIKEWVDYYGEDGVYVSFSGGKDSTVLLDIVRKMYPNVEAVFVNTGLEYPEIVDFVKKHENVTILWPKKNFRQVLTEYGYPVISKEVSLKISEVIEKPDGYAKKSFDGSRKGTMYDYSKYKYLLDSPFKISEHCCTVMKKNPFKKFEKANQKKPIMGITCDESEVRKKEWILHGCNAFDKKRKQSNPLSFWTNNDILTYIHTSFQYQVRTEILFQTIQDSSRDKQISMTCWENIRDANSRQPVAIGQDACFASTARILKKEKAV